MGEGDTLTTVTTMINVSKEIKKNSEIQQDKMLGEIMKSLAALLGRKGGCRL